RLRGRDADPTLPAVLDQGAAAAVALARPRVHELPARVAAHGQADIAYRPSGRQSSGGASLLMGRWPRVLLGVAISVAAAALLVVTTDLGQVADRLRQAQVVWLAPALLVLAAQAWVRATRWASLIRPSVERAVGAAQVLDAMLVGYFVNAILPGRLGEVARALVVSRREAVAFSGVAASVVVERAVDVMALAALASVALAL